MSNNNRTRNKVVAFRVTQEEDLLIEKTAEALGLTKQDFLTKNMLNTNIEITPNLRMLAGLRKVISALTTELQTYSANNKELPNDIITLTETFAKICTKLAGL